VSRATRLCICIGLTSSCVGAASAAPTQTTQRLVTVLATQTVRAAPNADARTIGTIPATTPITRVHNVLPLLGTAPGGWIRVALPGRPNGHSGWIRASSTKSARTDWRLDVDLSRRRLTVLQLGRVVRAFRVVVGKPSTPTPTGSFFVEEAVHLGAAGVGGPYALALSARSNVLQEFDGGPGQIAIHGRDNVGGTLGTAASHGCIRLDDAAIEWLVGRVGAGTPVAITP
jgi:lipoprotein-anchoring transpeptidase ErfK/SrfK